MTMAEKVTMTPTHTHASVTVEEADGVSTEPEEVGLAGGVSEDDKFAADGAAHVEGARPKLLPTWEMSERLELLQSTLQGG